MDVSAFLEVLRSQSFLLERLGGGRLGSSFIVVFSNRPASCEAESARSGPISVVHLQLSLADLQYLPVLASKIHSADDMRDYDLVAKDFWKAFRIPPGYEVK